jgi:iron complex transport system substrate-binding protein
MHYDASVFAPDKETVTLLEPDMIFSWDSYFGEKKLGDVYDWNQKGVATYISANSGAAKTRTLENEYNDILNIGRIFDAEEKAEALVDGMKRQVADALAAVQGQEAVRVAVLEPISGKITNYAADWPGTWYCSWAASWSSRRAAKWARRIWWPATRM